MTTEELAKLTPEQKRIKIAELCGWKYGAGCGTDGFVQWCNAPGSAVNLELNKIPDYLNDLNAMHEAEKMIRTLTKWDIYQQTLFVICANDSSEYPITHATAARRADAFLITLG